MAPPAPPSSEQQDLVRSIIRFLQDAKSDSAIATTDQLKDSLDVAVQCLAQVFQVEASQPQATPLMSVWRAGIKAVSASEDAQLDQDRHFQEFISLLRQKGYFANVAEGSPEWTARYNKAKREFRKRPPRPQAASASAASSSTTTTTPSSTEARAEAENLKVQGNKLMTQSKFAEAAELYSRAIALAPDVAIFYNNRAAAYTHLQRYDEAIQDCEVAIRLDPKYAKAYSRLGTAYYYKREYQLALDKGYSKAAELEPNNQTYKNDIKKVKDQLDARNNVSATSPPPAGMPDFSSIFGGMPGMSGMPGMPGMPGAGPGGMPDFAALMNNPAIMQMAQQMMSDPAFTGMIDNIMSGMTQGSSGSGGPGGMPDFSGLRDMMQNFAADPERDEPIFEEIRSDPEFANNPKFQQIIEDLRTKGPASIMQYMGDPEVATLMQKITGRFLEKKRAAAQSKSNSDEQQDPPTEQ